MKPLGRFFLTCLVYMLADPSTTQAQRNVPLHNMSQIIHYDADWNVTEDDSFEYYRIIQNYYDADKIFHVKDYYKDGKLQMEGTYVDRDCEIKDGDFVFYYHNGRVSALEHYENGILIDMYQSWYEDGSKTMEASYVLRPERAKKGANAETYLVIQNYWDKNHHQKVDNGEGSMNEDIGAYFTMRGRIHKGVKEGVWKGIDKQNKMSFKDKYKKGILVCGKSKDSLGHTYTYKEIFTDAYPLRGANDFGIFIYKTLQYPPDALQSNISGTVQVRFEINVNGQIQNVQTVDSSLYPSLRSEAIRVIKSYTNGFAPATYRGMKYVKTFVEPVVFKTTPYPEQ